MILNNTTKNHMEKNKTAVEWLFQKLWDEPKDKFTWYALREKAVKMQKEQLDNARPQIVSNCVIKEISDEEIEDVSGGDVSFEFGAKWYREQLKSRQ